MANACTARLRVSNSLVGQFFRLVRHLLLLTTAKCFFFLYWCFCHLLPTQAGQGPITLGDRSGFTAGTDIYLHAGGIGKWRSKHCHADLVLTGRSTKTVSDYKILPISQRLYRHCSGSANSFVVIFLWPVTTFTVHGLPILFCIERTKKTNIPTTDRTVQLPLEYFWNSCLLITNTYKGGAFGTGQGAIRSTIKVG